MTDSQDLLLNAVLRDADPHGCESALRCLQESAEPSWLLAGLSAGLSDASGLVRRRAAQALAKIGGDGCVAPLVQALHDRHWIVREAATLALANAPKTEVIEQALLHAVLRDKHALVREAAIRVLARAISPAMLSALREALSDAPPVVKRRALVALVHLRAHGVFFHAALVDAMHDSHSRVRQEALRTLAALAMPAGPALPVLLRRLYDRDASTRREATMALDRFAVELPLPIRDALDRLPLRPASAVVAAILDTGMMGEPVRQQFAQACERRASWYRSHLKVPAPAEERRGDAVEMARQAADVAGELAQRQARPGRDRAVACEIGAEQERAWQLACLCRLFQESEKAP